MLKLIDFNRMLARGGPSAGLEARLPSRLLAALFVAAAALLPTVSPSARPAVHAPAVEIKIDPTRVTNRFDGRMALGGAVDGIEAEAFAGAYNKETVKAVLKAGLGPVSYRLRTELGVEAWHWNAEGEWSSPSRKEGYWISKAPAPGVILKRSSGFRLPRRGTTSDQATDDSYSRITDGNPETFWKSNPYLDEYFTHESNELHSQWIVIDLGSEKTLNAVKIRWGPRFAVRYEVRYLVENNDRAQWRLFPKGKIVDNSGESRPLLLADRPVKARYVKLIFKASSEHEGAIVDDDIRSHLGVSVAELYLGLLNRDGSFSDLIRHGASQRTQTLTYASSTDPWHRSTDQNKEDVQPGFDLVVGSGLARGLPMLVPVGLLYDIPENALAEIRFLKDRGYPIAGVELGEEPDGQFIAPEDYAALYIQWADRLHELDPSLKLGGPSIQNADVDVDSFPWPEPTTGRPWLGRFVDYLRTHGHLEDLSFVSFEWYLHEDLCQPVKKQVPETAEVLRRVLKRIRDQGVPSTVPLLMTEFGYSAYSGEPSVTFAGALYDVESVAAFLTNGGKGAYFFRYEPVGLYRNSKSCGTWGALTLRLLLDNQALGPPVAAFHAMRLLAQRWIGEAGDVESLFTETKNASGRGQTGGVSAYTLRDLRGIKVLLVNKDAQQPRLARLSAVGTASLSRGQVRETQYSQAQYTWAAQGEDGRPRKNEPPVERDLDGIPDEGILLPPWSITVLEVADRLL